MGAETPAPREYAGGGFLSSDCGDGGVRFESVRRGVLGLGATPARSAGVGVFGAWPPRGL